MFSILFTLLIVLICFCVVTTDSINRCSRQKSRIVRNVINSRLVLPFQLMDEELPEVCPLYPYRDMYKLQEDSKLMESASKWTCGTCGKGFVAEEYLDRHFDNRHPNEIKIDKNSICLADYCDIFRCDIISGLRKPDFWDFALCMEDDMKEASNDCYKLMEVCLPKHITENETTHFKSLLQEAVCSYLTCSKFWEMPKPRIPDGKVALYVVLTILIAFGLMIYYCVFYQFYYTDTFTDSLVYDPTPQGRHRMIAYSDIRQRIARSSPS